MKITHKQLRRIIKEELSRTLDEGRYTGGVKVGDSVWLKDNRDKGQGVVRGKYKDLQMGHIISVQWETGETSRHIPSALATSQPMASTWQQRDDDPEYPESKKGGGFHGDLEEKGPYTSYEDAYDVMEKSKMWKGDIEYGFVWEIEERPDGYYVVKKEIY